MSDVPLLLPEYLQPRLSSSSWQPTKHLLPPNPPPVDEGQVRDQEMAAQRQLMDGKALKKTRPRRTVDYAGGMGRWGLVGACTYSKEPDCSGIIQLRKLRPSPYYVPHLRPGPSYIIDVSCAECPIVEQLQNIHAYFSASST
jgi:polyadenylation factor subunit 2